MGRWSYLDTDEERLPGGMTRIGYDADTQTYSYRDLDGSIWEGAPGNRYGQISKLSSPPPPNNRSKAYNVAKQPPRRGDLFDEGAITERRPGQQPNKANSSRMSSFPSMTPMPFPDYTWGKEHKNASLPAADDAPVVERKTRNTETETRRIKRRQAREKRRSLQRRSII